MILETSNITKTFGGLTALDDVSLEVEEGEIRAIIGPNGSGKSTFLNVLSGIYRPDRGTVKLAGESIEGQRPSLVNQKGMARTFQNLSLFSGMTVLANVLVGMNVVQHYGLAEALTTAGRYRSEEGEATRNATALLDRVGLHLVRSEEYPDSLSFGQRKLLEVARALASSPKVLLLDEPAGGLSSGETSALARLIRELRDSDGITVLVIEHNMPFVMDLADKVAVLVEGRKIADASPREVGADQAVIRAYLGGGGADDAFL